MVDAQLAVHEARLRLYRRIRLRPPIFVVSDFHAAVFNLRLDRLVSEDDLCDWFRARVMEYLDAVCISAHPKERYQNLPLQWQAFQRHMRVYYIAFRISCYRDRNVRDIAERLFMVKFGIEKRSVSEHLRQRIVHQRNGTKQLLHLVSQCKHLNSDVWSNIASFLHPIYIVRSPWTSSRKRPNESSPKQTKRPKSTHY